MLQNIHKRYSGQTLHCVRKLFRDTQYGFRPKRSTAEPLFCVRRLAEFAEQGTDPLYLIFLDSEKAFDKIDHEKMCQALWRLRIPPAILENINSLYANSLFQVIQGENASEWQKQRTGIRQGCPLSPYLFILTMHVMFHDVKHRFHDPHHIQTF